VTQQRPFAIGAVWFFILGGLGIWFPFYSLYLSENAGLTGTQVGIVLAMAPLMGIVAQPFWGQVADRSGLRSRVLFVIALCASLGYSGIYFASSFLGLMAATAALAFFASALIPSTVSVTLALAGNAGRHAFGFARVWGTVGFLVLVVSFPHLLDRIQDARGLVRVPDGPSEPGLAVMFPITTAIVMIGAFLTLSLPRTRELGLRAPRGDWRRLLRHGPFVRLLLFALPAYLFLQGPMALFPVFVRSHGGDMHTVSNMWILMLALEIPLVAFSGASLDRVGARGLLAIGVICGGVRWIICGFSGDLRWIYAVQILHGVVVAGLVVGGPLYVEAVVPERLRSTGQGLLAMVGVSIGGIASQVSAGWLLEHVGSDAPYAVGGIGALLLGCMVPFLLPKTSRPPEDGNERAVAPAQPH
jgi:PPP family 3-phenylpropionic acid transporter